MGGGTYASDIVIVVVTCRQLGKQPHTLKGGTCKKEKSSSVQKWRRNHILAGCCRLRLRAKNY